MNSMDVTKTNPKNEGGANLAPSRKVQSRTETATSSESRTSISSLVASSVALDTASDKVSVNEPKRSTSQNSAVRRKLNDAISLVNVAEESTSKISEFVESISGIAEQAASEQTNPDRRKVLEREGNELVDAIKRTAQTKTDSGVKPLAGDEIRIEIEEKLGKVLDAVLPDDAKQAFGIAQIDFSTKDSIISTITQVRQAEEQLKRLREAVGHVSKNVREVTDEIDVALQNAEASEVSVRDVEEALKLAHTTGRSIGEDPERAINSVGKFTENAAGLLK